MRFEGTLKRWNDEKGFGFIAPAQGGQELFVHVSAFPRDGRRPAESEPISFEVETRPDGKKQAVRVERPLPPGRRTAVEPKSAEPRSRQHSHARRSRKNPSWIALILLVVLGAWGYSRWAEQGLAPEPATTALPYVSEVPAGAGAFRCDGRTHCSQMTSCAEAEYFLKQCPGVQMDGNGDGEPCEQQWCTGPGAR